MKNEESRFAQNEESLLHSSLKRACALNSHFPYFKNRSARPGEKSSHNEATVQPGAKISL